MKGSALLIVLMLALMGVAYGQECTDIVQALSDYGTCTSACVGDDGIDESCLCDCYIGVYDAFESCSEVWYVFLLDCFFVCLFVIILHFLTPSLLLLTANTLVPPSSKRLLANI